jgi:hypothetical protein
MHLKQSFHIINNRYLPSIFIAPQLDLENYLPDSLDGNFGFDSYSTALGADITSDAHSESNMSNISNVYYNNGSMRLD